MQQRVEGGSLLGQICVISFMNGPKEILSHASHEAAHVKMTSRSIVTLILAIDNDIRRLIRLSTFSELNMSQKNGNLTPD